MTEGREALWPNSVSNRERPRGTPAHKALFTTNRPIIQPKVLASVAGMSSPQVTNSRLHNPELEVMSPQPGYPVAFRQYRETSNCSPSVSTASSSRTGNQKNKHGSYLRIPDSSGSFKSSRLKNDTILDHFMSEPTKFGWQEQRQVVQQSHDALPQWYQFYEILELGNTPTPEQCKDAPPSQAALARLPFLKVTRKDSFLGHYYMAFSKEEFQCQVKDTSGVICGRLFKKHGGTRARNNHVISCHTEIYDAHRDFRAYQCMIRGTKQPEDQDDGETPATPKKSKIELLRES
ncbi:hypothetical protein BGW38_009106, partial [Lunasporangiospora selenospora]